MPQDRFLSGFKPELTEIRSLGLVAAGGNQTSVYGTPSQTIGEAIKNLSNDYTDVRAVSRFFETPCFPAGAGPDYVNVAFTLSTSLTPRSLLELLHRIEAGFGRERVQRWGMRTLDLDLIALGDTVAPDAATARTWIDLPPDQQIGSAPSQLILPHPRLQDRAFVLVPLMDIAPDWRHPVLDKTVASMCAALPASDRAAVVPL